MKNWSNKNKLIMLAVCFFIVAILVYSLAVSETISARKNLLANTDTLVSINKAPESIARINEELGKIDRFIGSMSDTAATSTQEMLLEKVSRYCSENGVILKEFPQPLITTEKEYTIETCRIDLQGGFLKLLRFINLLEKERKAGKVVSAGFNCIKDMENKQYKLVASIYIQSIKRIK